MKRTLHMDGIAHNNRGQRQKEEMRAGKEKKRVQNQAQAKAPMCNWVEEKREMDEGGVNRQERVRSWRCDTRGQSRP